MQIALNIAGGIIVAVLTIACRWLSNKLRARKFRRVFGDCVDNRFHIIYNQYQSPPGNPVFPKLPSKVARIHASGGINLKTVNSCATTRAMGHLVYGFGESIKVSPLISSDIETDEKMDLSFVSIGGLTNYKSVDLLDDPSNVFLHFGRNTIISKTCKLPLVHLGQDAFDYAVIIKIHPENNAKRTWICCAGLGVWATSGAAWYLSHHWKEIQKFAKNKQFAYITKTRFGSDESTTVVHRFLSSNKVEKDANHILKSKKAENKPL